MVFAPGKYYRHSSGEKLAVLGWLNTFTYGRALIAEDKYGRFRPVGSERGHAVNWAEISLAEWNKPEKIERPATEGKVENG